jgi:type II secretory pathway pseudopilin PulG
MKKAFKKSGGFTIVETLFGISIFIVIVVALTLLSRNIWVYNTFVSASLNNVDMGRNTIKTFSREIRTASTADTGAYTISTATGTAFTFYSDIDNDGLKERVRYFLNGTIFQKGVIKPTGSPLTYNVANEVISTMLQNVTSTTVFEYYDKNYDGTTAPLSSPVTISSIRLVKVTLSTDKDPNRSPGITTFSTQVSIRNLKDNL